MPSVKVAVVASVGATFDALLSVSDVTGAEACLLASLWLIIANFDFGLLFEQRWWHKSNEI